ncbi:MAG: DUF6880 family protein [Terracidiphilus sp.]|jgi:hypothetical protein
MASKKTTTKDNLAALGADRLAAILLDLADDNAGVKWHLRLELEARMDDDTIAAKIGRRTTALRSALSLNDWQKQREFVKDLDRQRAMIVDRVADTRADLALDLMWRFLDLAEPVINRLDHSKGAVGEVFRFACEDLGKIAIKAKPDAAVLADQVFTAVMANDYGVFDDLVTNMLPALGDVGTAHLKSRLAGALRGRSRKATGRNQRVLRGALQEIADGEADVDGYIALVPQEDRSRQHIGAAIGRRLLAAGRTAEALAALENARPKQRARQTTDHDLDDLDVAKYYDGSSWKIVYIEALDASGQQEKAQTLRWAAFEERLSSPHLRAYLKKLSEFDDVEAEERAMAHVLGFGHFSVALAFLLEWPDQSRAAQLVLARASEINGNMYNLLNPVARLIEGKHPLAATLLRRAMIEDTLGGTKSTRYKHAARHLLECFSLAANIRDFGAFETHDIFVARLRVEHSRKTGFWAQVTGSSEGRP